VSVSSPVVPLIVQGGSAADAITAVSNAATTAVATAKMGRFT